MSIDTLPIDANVLASAISATLNRPPSRVGARLRPEVELAKELNVGRRMIRTSLDKLVRKGILVRRQGSGTYVRRLPKHDLLRFSKDELDLVSPELLFAPPAEEAPVDIPLRPTASQRRLHFSVWTNAYCQRSSQLIFAGMMKRANRAGNHISLHSLTERHEVPIPLSLLREQLRDEVCDGYVILEPWADLVRQAIGRIDKPAVYFWALTVLEARYHPLVTLDTFSFYREAVTRLNQQAYRRIAAVGLTTLPLESIELAESLYNAAIAACGLDYRAMVFTPLGVSAAYEATQTLLSRPDPPEAIIVADDHLLTGVVGAIEAAHRVPGGDIGLIGYANKGMPLGDRYKFSALEYDLEAFGELIWDVLLRTVEAAGTNIPPISLAPLWKPGKTHLRGGVAT